MKTIFTLLLCTLVSATLAQIPVNGLLAYYPFCGNSLDISGNGHHLVNSNATLTTDRFNTTSSAYSFNGLNSMLSNDTVFNLDTAYTLSFWMVANAPQDALLVYNGNGNINGIGMIYNGGLPFTSTGTVVSALAGGVNIYMPTSLSISTWHHVVLTKRSVNNYSYLYIDNVLIDSAIASPNPAIGKFHIGLDYSDNTNPFNGKIDDVAIYDRALTDVEIAQIGVTVCQLSPLAITFNSLSVKRTNKGVQLEWVTTPESQTSHFEIQKSTDSKTWQVIASSNASAFFKKEWVYNYIDISSPKGDLYYRIKEIALDGSSLYSQIKKLNGHSGVKLVPSPNPATRFINFPVGASVKQADIALYDKTGVNKLPGLKMTRISNDITLDLSDLPNGLYFLTVGNEKAIITKQ